MFRKCLLCLFAFTVTASAQSTASKSVTTFIIDAPQLGGQKKIWVYLPQDYALSDKKYPVLYMHDAQNLFDAKTSYVGEWNVDEALDSLHAKVIVVGIEHGGDKRLDELTPYKNEKYGGGHADSYLEFVVKTLKPEIEKRYRTKAGARNTGIMGSSLGGLVSFYAALKYPDVFGKAGVFSPSFWYSKDIYDLAEKQKKIRAKIYFLAGGSESEDMVPDLEKMTAIVSTKRCDCLHLTKKKIIPGAQHNEKLWREHFAEAFKWLF